MFPSARSASSSSSPPKYSHHRQPVNANPSTATPTSAGSTGSFAAPIPMATMDSPNAMITTSPCRSTKCPAWMTNPSCPDRYGAITCRQNAADHSTNSAVPPTIPATSTRIADTKLNGASRKIARTALSAVVLVNSAVCTPVTSRYPNPNASPACPSNVPGIASAMIRNPAIPAINSSRREVVVGGTALVNHAYPPYIHHVTPSIKIAENSPRQPGSSSRIAVSWVIVNTNTRSKNSSSVLTLIESSEEVMAG